MCHEWKPAGVGARVFQLGTHLDPDVLWAIWKTPFSQPCLRKSQPSAPLPAPAALCSLLPGSGTAGAGSSGCQSCTEWTTAGTAWAPGSSPRTFPCCPELPSPPDAAAALQMLQNGRVSELQLGFATTLHTCVCPSQRPPNACHGLKPRTCSVDGPHPDSASGCTVLERLLQVRSSAFSCSDSPSCSCLGRVA